VEFRKDWRTHNQFTIQLLTTGKLRPNKIFWCRWQCQPELALRNLNFLENKSGEAEFLAYVKKVFGDKTLFIA
jgi:hypothetical protein